MNNIFAQGVKSVTAKSAMSKNKFMARALQLAEYGLYTTQPNPNVGCVIVKNKQIIAEGWHQRAGQAHAEVNALTSLTAHEAVGADCYITLEPCSHTGRTPPCADKLVEMGIKRAYIAMSDPNPLVAGKGIKKLQDAGIDVQVGLLQEQAEALNKGFCKRMRSAKPYVRSKLAMSLDGRTAMASGESKWITSPDARQDVQKLRAQSSAILTGIGTVLADDPALDVRVEDNGWYPENEQLRQPHLIIVDSQLKLSPTARLFNTTAEKFIATVQPENNNYDARIVSLPDIDGRVNLPALMGFLAEQQLNDVLVEAGPSLNGALLQHQLIDELVIYMAPKLMGDGARGLFNLPAIQSMTQSVDLDIIDIRAVGKDWRFTVIPKYK